MSGPLALYEAAKELLGAAYEGVQMTTGGPIERAYVCPGLPAFDDLPQLTVHAGAPQVADTMPLMPPLQPAHRQRISSVELVALTITVVRAIPVIEQQGEYPVAPSPYDLDAAAQDTMSDLWGVLNHVKHRYRNRTLFTRPDGQQREFLIEPAISLTTSGGAAGWEIPVRVQLDGYDAGVT